MHSKARDRVVSFTNGGINVCEPGVHRQVQVQRQQSCTGAEQAEAVGETVSDTSASFIFKPYSIKFIPVTWLVVLQHPSPPPLSLFSPQA